MYTLIIQQLGTNQIAGFRPPVVYLSNRSRQAVVCAHYTTVNGRCPDPTRSGGPATPFTIYLYNGGPKSSDLIGSQLLYNERIHNCYDARSFCESLHITPRLEV